MQLPQGLYNAFTEVLDSNPTANRVANQIARKQAKMDALDKYDQDRINHVNDQGVRDKDRQGFDNRLQDIRNYYNTNKDKIRKGSTAEAYEYEKKFRDVSSYVNQSKERTAKQDAAMKFYQDKLKQDGRVPDDFMTELHSNDSGIDETDSKTFDLTKWLSIPKPYSQQSALKGYADIKRVPTTRTEAIPGNPLKVNEITEETFDDGAKQVIATRAANDFQNSYSFSDAVLTDIKDPVTRAKLEQTFKDNYGTAPQTNEDYATAFRIQELQPKIVKSKTVDNKDAIMNKQQSFTREMTETRHQNSLKRIAANWGYRERSEQNIGASIDGLIADHIKSANPDGEVLTDKETFKAITGQDQTSSSFLKVDANGNYTYGKKIKDADGKETIEVKGQVPYSLGKAKLVDQYKGGYNKNINPANNTKPKSKPNKPAKVTDPALLKKLNG